MTRAESSYVLDEQNRITQVSGPLKAKLGPFVGHTFWEAAPQAQELFGPHFEEARTSGREVEFTAYYAGWLATRRVVPAGRSLTVFVKPIRELDCRTLATLTESLRAIEAELAARAPEQSDVRAHASRRARP
ncbi:MAG TPA: hypothetical protein VNJ53_09635 [Gaiellaceae bacterium]|nr:hypothetical protein [Gaiellaceae bacterium]